MKSEDEYMELENEAPNLGAINKKNPFKTPERYFEELSPKIFSQAKLTELSGETADFRVPENYFENLAEQIQLQLSINNTVAGVNNPGFNLPATYFAESKNNILSKVSSTPKKAKIVNLHFVRYAAAACILLTTTLGIYFNVQYNTKITNQLAKIPAKEIETYLNQHTDANDLPMLIENLDDDVKLNIDNFDVEKTD